MTIRMVVEHREDYGYSDAYEIRVSCDWCGERIRELRDGIYAWRIQTVTGATIDGTMHHLHNSCATTFGTANSGEWGWAWERLLNLHMNLLGNLRSLGGQEQRERLRARSHVEDVLYPDAGEPGSEFWAVTRQESERWAQEHPAIQLKEGHVYEAAVLLRRIDRAKQEMDATLGDLLRQIEAEADADVPEQEVETSEPEGQAAD